MFWKPDKTGQRKQKERSLARNTHPQTAARAPANSNRESKFVTRTPANPNRETESFTRAAAISNRKPKLLETPQLQQNIPGSGLSIVSAIAEQSTQPGDINGPALIAKKPTFSPSILTHLPQPARAEQSGRRAPTNHLRIRPTRRKRESAPLIYVSIKRRPDRLFS
jgi:hypothetical protein